MKWHIIIVCAALVACAHGGRQTDAAPTDPDRDAHGDCRLPDTLKVGTLYSPTSFFIYRGDSLGIDYDMVRDFAESIDRPMVLKVARSVSQLIAMLDSGTIDFAATGLPVIAEYEDRVLPCGFEAITHQVLVQCVSPGEEAEVTEVTQLPGKEVFVLKDSKYEHRLRNLNQELGGGIIIRTLNPDSVAPEDLVDMVADGEIQFAVLDSDKARLHGGYHANINSDVVISLDQRSAWGVAPDRQCMADAVDSWALQAEPNSRRADLLKRYYQLEKLGDNVRYGAIDFSNGTISDKYDSIFRRYAHTINWDWRMLAAQAYTESRFNPTARSFAGARGLMQIMPRTGRSYGLRNANDPEQSVRAAVSYLDDLDRMFADKVADPDERKKFVLASYNAGQGHIFDAMRLAEKTGLNPTKWDDNVEKAVLMLANPAHYNDSVVKYGYLRGRETHDYVNRIMTLYNLGKTAIPV